MSRTLVFATLVDGVAGYQIVALEGADTIIGCGTLTLWPVEGPLLTGLYVAPNKRRQGIGRGIVRTAMTLSMAITRKPLNVYYRPDGDSRPMFEGMGFEVTEPPDRFTETPAYIWAQAPEKAA